jgi:hypothetical protein
MDVATQVVGGKILLKSTAPTASGAVTDDAAH